MDWVLLWLFYLWWKSIILTFLFSDILHAPISYECLPSPSSPLTVKSPIPLSHPLHTILYIEKGGSVFLHLFVPSIKLVRMFINPSATISHLYHNILCNTDVYPVAHYRLQRDYHCYCTIFRATLWVWDRERISSLKRRGKVMRSYNYSNPYSTKGNAIFYSYGRTGMQPPVHLYKI